MPDRLPTALAIACTPEWFPGHMPPPQIGVYERDYRPFDIKRPLYCFWHRGVWWTASGDADKAAYVEMASPFQNLPWRPIQNPEK